MRVFPSIDVEFSPQWVRVFPTVYAGFRLLQLLSDGRSMDTMVVSPRGTTRQCLESSRARLHRLFWALSQSHWISGFGIT